MSMRRLGAGAALLAALTLATAATARAADATPTEVPEWLYPLNPTAAGGEPRPDPEERVRIPDVATSFRNAELGDFFAAPDWRPASHTPMPDIVAHGRAPGVRVPNGRPASSSRSCPPRAAFRRCL